MMSFMFYVVVMTNLMFSINNNLLLLNFVMLCLLLSVDLLLLNFIEGIFLMVLIYFSAIIVMFLFSLLFIAPSSLSSYSFSSIPLIFFVMVILCLLDLWIIAKVSVDTSQYFNSSYNPTTLTVGFSHSYFFYQSPLITKMYMFMTLVIFSSSIGTTNIMYSNLMNSNLSYMSSISVLLFDNYLLLIILLLFMYVTFLMNSFFNKSSSNSTFA